MKVTDAVNNAYNPINRPKGREKKVSEAESAGSKPGSDDPTMEGEDFSEGKRDEALTYGRDQKPVAEEEPPELDTIA